MSRFQKALDRLTSKPKDLTWKELQTIMAHFGYDEIKGGGSRKKFVHGKTKAVVSLHEPHPKTILKAYAVDLVIEHLTEAGFL